MLSYFILKHGPKDTLGCIYAWTMRLKCTYIYTSEEIQPCEVYESKKCIKFKDKTYTEEKRRVK